MSAPAAVPQDVRDLGDFRVADSHRRFWDLFATGRWEPGTRAALSSLLGPGRRFVDVGAWIGPTTLAAAHLGARVVAFEPDPAAFALLRRNLDLNPALARNVEALPLALATDSGRLRLHSREAGNSETSVFDLHLRRGQAKPARLAFEVEALGVADACAHHDLPGADLIKLDLEGAEYLLLPALLTAFGAARPPLLLSFHPMNLIGLPAEERRSLGEGLLAALGGYRAEAWTGAGWTVADAAALRAAAHAPDAAEHSFLLRTDG